MQNRLLRIDNNKYCIYLISLNTWVNYNNLYQMIKFRKFIRNFKKYKINKKL